MMLCHGGVSFLKSPGQTGGKRDIEKVFIELEARLSHFRQGARSQVFKPKLDNIRTKRVDAKFPHFTGSPSGTEDEVKLRVLEASNTINCKNRQDEASRKSEKTLFSGASFKQDAFRPSTIKCFSESPSSDAQDHGGEDWRSLSRALASGAKVASISNHELMRIAELRFSTDMNEGDSGNHVVLLQKALFWLGHLSKQSDITGYFGIETKQALCEFQDAHGVGRTGLWGSLSKQALWHTVSAEILHRAVDEKSSRAAEGNFRAESNIFKQIFQSCSSTNFADVFITTPPQCDWRFLSGIIFLTVGVFVGLFISRVSFLPVDNHLMKRKIVRSGESEKDSSISKDKKSDNTPSSSGAAVMNSMSEPTSWNPPHAVDVSANGQMDELAMHDRKVFPGPSYISSLGHGVQNGAPKSQGVMKKQAFSLPIPMQRLSSSKPRAKSVKVKQPGQLIRPINQSGTFSRIREKGDSTSLSSGTQEAPRLPKQGSEPIFPRSTAKHPFVGQKDDLPGASKRFENDFQLTEDGAAVGMQDEEESNVRKRIEELRKAVEAAEQNGQAAVLALVDERKKSLELEDKISKQRESAAALEEEVRVLKESHDALLESLRKKTGPATRGASLLYGDFKNGRSGLS